MGMHGGYYLGEAEGWVTEPDGTRRRGQAEDNMLIINEDGTVTIPTHVDVHEVHGTLSFRTDRLQGWAVHNPDSRIMVGERRTLREEVVAELARQGRSLLGEVTDLS